METRKWKIILTLAAFLVACAWNILREPVKTPTSEPKKISEPAWPHAPWEERDKGCRRVDYALLTNGMIQSMREGLSRTTFNANSGGEKRKESCSRCYCMMSDRTKCHYACAEIPEDRAPTLAEDHMCRHLCAAKGKGLDLMDENEAPHNKN